MPKLKSIILRSRRPRAQARRSLANVILSGPRFGLRLAEGALASRARRPKQQVQLKRWQRHLAEGSERGKRMPPSGANKRRPLGLNHTPPDVCAPWPRRRATGRLYYGGQKQTSCRKFLFSYHAMM